MTTGKIINELIKHEIEMRALLDELYNERLENKNDDTFITYRQLVFNVPILKVKE